MGNYRSTPAKDIEREEGSGPFYEFASASMQGWRIQQEVCALLLQHPFVEFD
jgi:hypothetical protein